MPDSGVRSYVLLPRSPWSHLATLGRPTETRGLDAEYAEKILKEFVPRPSAGRTEPNEVRPFDLHALSTPPAFILS